MTQALSREAVLVSLAFGAALIQSTLRAQQLKNQKKVLNAKRG